jgi:translation initiation factor IF-1
MSDASPLTDTTHSAIMGTVSGKQKKGEQYVVVTCNGDYVTCEIWDFEEGKDDDVFYLCYDAM